MIADDETNFLYLANTLPKRHPKFFHEFEKILNQCGIEFSLLPNTKDIWAVDYMPIQIEQKKFVQFVYNPDYLRNYKKWVKTISDVDIICKAIKISPVKTDILVDGGNVIRVKNKVIMTDKVFNENPQYERKHITKKLAELLEVDNIYFIPQQPKDITGHADGMVRFSNDETVIINNYKDEKKEFKRAFETALHNAGFNTIEIPYNIKGNKKDIQANGIYINYLQMKNTIIVPTFGIAEDDEAIKKFKELFSGQTIKTIDSNEIANEGGILNCISWNIFME